MGGKGGSSYHERQLTPEERALIAQQQQYLASIQPGIDKLIGAGISGLNDVINPDWQSIYSQEVKDINQIRKEQAELATGKLPQIYSDSKKLYFNRMYENTMGNYLAKMAKSGVVDSSRFNTSVNDVQKNFAAEMSKDYTQDLGMASKLLDQKYEFAKAPMESAMRANKASFQNPAQHIGLAMGLGDQINQSVQTTGQLNNGRGYVTQEGPGFFGGLMSGVGSYLACFPKDTLIATNRGDLPISELEAGDIVIAKDGVEKIVKVVPMSEEELIYLETSTHDVHTTITQTVCTRNGFKHLYEVAEGVEILTDTGFEPITAIHPTDEYERVYELIVTGSNTFYAQGICVEGLDEEDRIDVLR